MSDDTNIGDIKLIIKYDNLIFILNVSAIITEITLIVPK